MNRQYVLLNPGPVNTSIRVKRALLRGDLCHREKEFSEILLRVRENLLKAFKLEGKFAPIFLTGSGTAALEATLVSILNGTRKVLVLSNGVYGDRVDQIVTVHGFRKEVFRLPSGNPVPVEKIDAILNSDSEIDAVAMVHHETSTGMINPVAEIGKLRSMNGKKLIVDSVSALGGEAIDLIDARVTACACTANKCVQGLPGVSFVLIAKSELERLKSLPPRSLYLDLAGYWREQEHGGVPFTPSVQTFYALDEALKELIREGVAKRIRRYQKYAKRFRAGFEKMGISYLIDPRYHSNTLTALKLPEGLSYEVLHAQLKKEGFIIYAGQGPLQGKIFRVANMGELRIKDIERFLKWLERILKKTPPEADLRHRRMSLWLKPSAMTEKV